MIGGGGGLIAAFAYQGRHIFKKGRRSVPSRRSSYGEFRACFCRPRWCRRGVSRIDRKLFQFLEDRNPARNAAVPEFVKMRRQFAERGLAAQIDQHSARLLGQQPGVQGKNNWRDAKRFDKVGKFPSRPLIPLLEPHSTLDNHAGGKHVGARLRRDQPINQVFRARKFPRKFLNGLNTFLPAKVARSATRGQRHAVMHDLLRSATSGCWRRFRPATKTQAPSS